MKTLKPLVDKNYLLQKFEGKGGWTFAEIPEIPMPKTSFGMLKVKGKIDNYEFSDAVYFLLEMAIYLWLLIYN